MHGFETGMLFQALDQMFRDSKRAAELKRKQEIAAWAEYNIAAEDKAQDIMSRLNIGEINLSQAETEILSIPNLVFQKIVDNHFQQLLHNNLFIKQLETQDRLHDLSSETAD